MTAPCCPNILVALIPTIFAALLNASPVECFLTYFVMRIWLDLQEKS